MSSLTMKFDVVGDSTLHSIFDNLETIPDDFTPVFRKMAQDFWQHENEVFDSEGPGWKTLSARYEKWKERHYPGAPILVRTGALKASLTSGNAANSIYDLRPKMMRLGTSIPYAIYHQTGSIKVENHPPQRKEVTIPDYLQTVWNRRMITWLREEVDYKG